MEQQKYIEKIAIEEKLKSAQTLRDENIKKMLERLKEHVSFSKKTKKNESSFKINNQCTSVSTGPTHPKSK